MVCLFVLSTLSLMASQTIFVYSDENPGVSPGSFETIKRAFESCAPKGREISLIPILAEEIKQGILSQNTLLQGSIFVMPGGAATPYRQALGKDGMRAICDFVQHNYGIYIGLCAGAYFGCKHIEFQLSHNEQITNTGLGLWGETARGPLFDYVPGSESGSRILGVACEDGKARYSYYNGGCYFEHADPAYILATYVENEDHVFGGLPAIIQAPFGKGKVILSGLHPEEQPEDFCELARTLGDPSVEVPEGSIERIKANISELRSKQREGYELWRYLLTFVWNSNLTPNVEQQQ